MGAYRSMGAKRDEYGTLTSSVTPCAQIGSHNLEVKTNDATKA